MRKQTMVTDREAEASQQPHAEKKTDLGDADRPVEQQSERDGGTGKRQHVEDNEVPPLQFMKMAALDDPVIAHFHTGFGSSRWGISTQSRKLPQPLPTVKKASPQWLDFQQIPF